MCLPTFSTSPAVKMHGSTTEIKVLAKCRDSFKSISLCQKLPFQIGHLKFPNILMFMLHSMPISIGIFLEFLTVYDIGWHITDAAGVILIILGFIQILSIYFSLANQNQSIIEMIDRIQDVVNRSEFSSDLFFFLLYFE